MTTCEVSRISEASRLTAIMWKTVSDACNLACDYCYYSGNGNLETIKPIDDHLLDKTIKEYMQISQGAATFIWQGGEPLLAGLDFFKKVVALQAKHASKNTIISNSIQTNGTLITDEWATFFKKYNFLVGVSLDGPQHINDARRMTGSGKGSFRKIMQGIECLIQANVQFNILTVLHENNIHHASTLMNFYKEKQLHYIQFLPCMNFRAQNIDDPGQFLITPKQYGDFLCEAFDNWYNYGDPEISIQFFDHLLLMYVHEMASLCIHGDTCPTHIILEQNGDAYPCDFFMNEKFKLGNGASDSLASLLDNKVREKFNLLKPAIPKQCRNCLYLKFCHGGCPRNRIKNNGEHGSEYFCESYKQIFSYAHEKMTFLSAKIKRNKLINSVNAGMKLPRRNDVCICGSGKKFKKCCEPFVHDLFTVH